MRNGSLRDISSMVGFDRPAAAASRASRGDAEDTARRSSDAPVIGIAALASHSGGDTLPQNRTAPSTRAIPPAITIAQSYAPVITTDVQPTPCARAARDEKRLTPPIAGRLIRFISMIGGSLEGRRSASGLRTARPGLAGLLALVLAATTLGEARLAYAQDRVAELTQTLASSSEKARLAATVALGNLGDRRALRPLVAALADPSPQIRVVAAVALGKLGHKAALPSLKNTANDDADEKVRKASRAAAIAVAQANQLPSPWPEPAATPASAAAVAAAARPTKPGFGRQPRALVASPDVYVLVNTTNDDSPGKADKAARKEHADILRQTLVSHCNSNPGVTTVAADAKRLGLDPRHIDLSVVKMEVATVGGLVEVDAQLRLAISDGRGKMLSFLSGGAKIQVPKNRFDPRYLPKLRREAIENAVSGMFDKLVAHLRDQRANS